MIDAKLMTFLCYQKGWDGDAADTPSFRAIDHARALIKRIGTPHDVAACPQGTILVTWRWGKNELEIEADDRTSGFLLCRHTPDGFCYEEGDGISDETVLVMARGLMGG